MKKISILSVCIVMILLLGMIDIRRQIEEGKWKIGDKDQPVMAKIEEMGRAETEEPLEGKPGETQAAQDIRVLICSGYYESLYHAEVTIAAQEGFLMSYGDKEEEYPGGEEIVISGENAEFEESNVLYLSSKNGKFMFPGLQRSIENPVYEGSIEIRKTDAGLLVINQLPLETYLCYVVPSEMPSGYPKEALKAQAICARTYAQEQILEGRAQEFYADVDDSVSYQVYNNQGRTEATDLAVAETAGIVLKRDGELLDARYYSTSCGMDLDVDMSDEAVFAAFLAEDHLKAYEAKEPWYRWNTEICLADLGDVSEIAVKERSQSGRIESIEVSYASKAAPEIISGEYKIREFLDSADPMVYLQNGETVTGMGLLPSAFFVMTPEYDENGTLTGYFLKGGGYGHGEGMSQNGAKGMAEEGMGYKEILEKYYGSFD